MTGGGVTAGFGVQTDDCTICRLTGVARTIAVEIEPTVPLGGRTAPSMRVYGDDGDYRSFERVLDERPEVGTWRELARRADRRIYQVDWTDGLGPVFDTLDDVGGLVRSIWSARGRASFEAQFPDHADVSAFYDRCADSGVELEVTKLEQAGRTAADDYGLTPEQRDTLLAAYEAGYYEIPRDITAVELADELGVSDQSLSERLRRAHANLVEATIE